MIRTRSARYAITIATAQGWDCSDDGLDVVVQSGSKGNNEGQILHGLDCGRVLSVVESQRPEVMNWLYLAYGAPGWASDAMKMACETALYRHEKQPKDDAEKIATLVEVAVEDMRRRVCGLSGYIPAMYAKRVRFDPRRWDNWSRRVENLHRVMDRWDREGLRGVAEMLQEWREFRESA